MLFHEQSLECLRLCGDQRLTAKVCFAELNSPAGQRRCLMMAEENVFDRICSFTTE